jgi:hypothetical protein
MLFVLGSFCGSLFANPFTSLFANLFAGLGKQGELDVKLKKPYRNSAQVSNDCSGIEICLKNKSKKDIVCFTVVVYVSVDESADYGADYAADYDADYGAGFERGDGDYDFGGGDESAGYGWGDGVLHQFVWRVEERVGGNERVVFVYPLEPESLFGFSDDEGYTGIQYEIDFIYISEIEYTDGEKWFYKGS